MKLKWQQVHKQFNYTCFFFSNYMVMKCWMVLIVCVFRILEMHIGAQNNKTVLQKHSWKSWLAVLVPVNITAPCKMQPITEECGSSLQLVENLTNVKKHQCSQCHKTFAYAEGLRIHMISHTGVKPYRCRHCDSSFYFLCDLQAHSRTHSAGKRYACTFCGKFIADKYALMLHMRQHTGEKPYSCHFCETAFARKSDLRKHTRIHTKEQLYKCKYCDRTFSQLQSAKYHEASHAIENKYSCTECDSAFSHRSGLVRHARIHAHTGKKNCLCKDCLDGTIAYDKVNKVFNCPFCTASFSRLDRLKVHLKSRGKLIHSCKACSMTFCTENSLYEHLKTHERAYVCQFCDLAFLLRTELLAHIQRHATKRRHKNRVPHVCKYCPFNSFIGTIVNCLS